MATKTRRKTPKSAKYATHVFGLLPFCLLFLEVPVPSIQDITDVDHYKKTLEDALKYTNEFIAKDKKDAAEQKLRETTDKKATAMYL